LNGVEMHFQLSRQYYGGQSITMNYKGYEAGPLNFDADEGTYSGVVAGLKDVMHFEGSTTAELKVSFQASIDEYLALRMRRSEPLV
jgi:predicted HicB family RNase H-like nuclease